MLVRFIIYFIIAIASVVSSILEHRAKNTKLKNICQIFTPLSCLAVSYGIVFELYLYAFAGDEIQIIKLMLIIFSYTYMHNVVGFTFLYKPANDTMRGILIIAKLINYIICLSAYVICIIYIIKLSL